jgi:SSS family solute:Na+ symporter
VSLLTEKPSEAKLQGLTYSTTVREDRERSRASWSTMDVVSSVIILVLIVAIFIYFSPLGVAG